VKFFRPIKNSNKEAILVSKKVEIVNQLGLHARAAAKFVHLASKFESQINITKDGIVVDGKSILGILMLAAAYGTIIEISAVGEDEEIATKALAELVKKGFEE
jgi:phosphocarrier protein